MFIKRHLNKSDLLFLLLRILKMWGFLKMLYLNKKVLFKNEVLKFKYWRSIFILLRNIHFLDFFKLLSLKILRLAKNSHIVFQFQIPRA